MSNYDAQVSKMQSVVVAKAIADAAFAAELKANPRAAVEKVFKVTLPAHIAIQVNEAPANTVVVNLPHTAAVAPSGELSDADLEAVAGGSKSGAEAFFTGVGSVAGVVVAAPVAQSVPVAEACF